MSVSSSTSAPVQVTIKRVQDETSFLEKICDSAFHGPNRVISQLGNTAQLCMNMDFGPILETAGSQPHTLATPVYILSGRTSHLITDPDAIAVLAHQPRNKEGGIFQVDEKVSTNLAFFKTLYPDEEIHANDVILTADEKASKMLRTPFLRTFTNHSINQHYAAQITELVKKILDRCAKATNPVNISKEIRLFTATVIGKVILGMVPPEGMTEDEYFESIGTAVDTINDFYIQGMCLRTVDKEVLKASRKTFKDSMNLCLASSKAPFVEELRRLQNNDDPEMKMSELQAKLMIATLFIAGQETTVTALTELFFQLCHYPKAQDQIAQCKQEEAKRILIRQSIMEALRTNPPAYVLTGRLVQSPFMIEVTQGNERLDHYGPIKPGDVVTCCPFLAAKDSTKYPTPSLFDPSRHAGITTMPWLPFGSGPQECPGRNLFFFEATQFVDQLVTQYTITTAQNVKPACKKMMTSHFIEDLFISLVKRS